MEGIPEADTKEHERQLNAGGKLKQTEVTGGQISQIRWVAEQFVSGIFGWQSMLTMMYDQMIKQHRSSQLSSSLLFQCRSTFSNQISVVCSTDSSAMFQIVSQYSSFRIPEYGGYDFAG